MERDGNAPGTIARQLVKQGDYDIFALQEVLPDNIGGYGNAIREGFGKSHRFFATARTAATGCTTATAGPTLCHRQAVPFS